MARKPRNGKTPDDIPVFPTIVQTPLPPSTVRAQRRGQIGEAVFAYRMGELSILVSVEVGKGWHMSIAHPTRYPTWDECVHLRYELVPNEITLALLLPPKEAFIKADPPCFQFYQVGVPR